MPRPMSGQVQTVLGPIATEAMGITLPHEHLLIDFKVMFVEPAAASDKGRAWQPVSLDNLGWVRQNFNSNLDNLRLTDERVAQDEILLFKNAGGRTVVDPTPKTLARDPLALARIARSTGLNVVMGAGYYVAASHPPDMDRRTVDKLTREMIGDVTAGAGDTGIRSGVLGEIGCTWPWTDNEKKVLRAAIAAQRETGAPLMVHPGRHPRMPMDIAELIQKEGGDLRRTIMCHICRTIADIKAVIDLAATGIWLEYDLFGLENSYYPYQPSFDMPNDGGRMAHVLALIEAGHHDRVLLSHDIAYKTSLVKYGGYGYHHLLLNVVPRLRMKGIDDAGLRRLLVDNPARAFTFA
ncbi:MAG TPA: aryldialkylphosphatase [Candidatus Limnocylindria bacterium]|nr:aryldialkylphosphatase [Candidatus Limnocylindria bacterium]